MFLKPFACAAALALSATAAGAEVVDFEDIVGFDGSLVIDSGGFSWSFSASGWGIGDPASPGVSYPDGTTNGTNILIASGDSAGQTARVTMTPLGGGMFDLFSVSAASSNMTLANDVRIIGMLSAGGTVEQTLIGVDGSFDTYALSGFSDVTSVMFESLVSGGYNVAGFALDDLDLDAAPPIPLPPALPMVAAGLGLLGALRLRRGA